MTVSRCMGPMQVANLRSIELLEGGYEDFTINLFERETGTQIPVDKRDPQRFEKRYQWLMNHARESWVQWRCNKYTELFRKLRDRIAHGRPDRQLRIVLSEPLMMQGSQEILDGHYDDSWYGLDMLRQFGFDLSALRKEPGIAIDNTYAIAGGGAALSAERHQGWREFTQNTAWQSLLANDNKSGAYIKAGLSHYGNYMFPDGRWLFTSVETRQGWFWSTHVNETFVNVLAKSNPTWIQHTWCDLSESMGRIQELRTFARAYRSLPNGHYERLTGNGMDRNIWISRTNAQAGEFAYAANLNWWRPRLTLRFTSGADVQNLIRDEPVTLENGAWTFSMAPYSIQSFRVARGKIISAEVTLDDADRAYVRSGIEKTLREAESTIFEARKREAQLAGQYGWEALTELELRTTELKVRFQDGDLAGAYRLTTGALPMDQDTITRILRGQKIIRGYR